MPKLDTYTAITRARRLVLELEGLRPSPSRIDTYKAITKANRLVYEELYGTRSLIDLVYKNIYSKRSRGGVD